MTGSGDRRGSSRVLRLVLSASFLTAASTLVWGQVPDGRSYWQFQTGGGVTYHMHEENSDEQAVLVAPAYSKPLGDHWEYVVEGHVSRLISPPGYLAGLLPVGARYLPTTTTVRPFVGLGAGIGWTDVSDIPEISRRFNFLLQGDLGVRWPAGNGDFWQVSARWFHVSNAGTQEPNLGLNVLMLLIGFRL